MALTGSFMKPVISATSNTRLCDAMPKSKCKIIVLGFMGACPIAGVIWQVIHYMVGLQRLGHDVYYVEDSARAAYYDPLVYTLTEDTTYAVNVLNRLAGEFGFA